MMISSKIKVLRQKKIEGWEVFAVRLGQVANPAPNEKGIGTHSYRNLSMIKVARDDLGKRHA